MSKKQIKSASNPHDQFFRKVMQDGRVAREFLQTHLPSEMRAVVDFDELVLQPRSQVNAIHDHIKLHKTTRIPLIHPLVVYHGRPYQFTKDICDLVDAPRELVDKYFLKPFHLLDLSQIEDEVMKQHAWSGVMEFVLKHIFERDMLPFLL